MLILGLLFMSMKLLKIIRAQSVSSYCPVGIIGESAYSTACDIEQIYCKVNDRNYFSMNNIVYIRHYINEFVFHFKTFKPKPWVYS